MLKREKIFALFICCSHFVGADSMAPAAPRYPKIVFFINRVDNRTDYPVDVIDSSSSKIVFTIPAHIKKFFGHRISEGVKYTIKNGLENYELRCLKEGMNIAKCRISNITEDVLEQFIKQIKFDLNKHQDEITDKTDRIKANINIIIDGPGTIISLIPLGENMSQAV